MKLLSYADLTAQRYPPLPLPSASIILVREIFGVFRFNRMQFYRNLKFAAAAAA